PPGAATHAAATTTPSTPPKRSIDRGTRLIVPCKQTAPGAAHHAGLATGAALPVTTCDDYGPRARIPSTETAATEARGADREGGRADAGRGGRGRRRPAATRRLRVDPPGTRDGLVGHQGGGASCRSPRGHVTGEQLRLQRLHRHGAGAVRAGLRHRAPR